jgi:hypothetical protein
MCPFEAVRLTTPTRCHVADLLGSGPYVIVASNGVEALAIFG